MERLDDDYLRYMVNAVTINIHPSPSDHEVYLMCSELLARRAADLHSAIECNCVDAIGFDATVPSSERLPATFARQHESEFAT